MSQARRKRGPNSKVLATVPNLLDGGEARISQHPLPDGRVRVWVAGDRPILDMSIWNGEGWEIVLGPKAEPKPEQD